MGIVAPNTVQIPIRTQGEGGQALPGIGMHAGELRWRKGQGPRSPEDPPNLRYHKSGAPQRAEYLLVHKSAGQKARPNLVQTTPVSRLMNGTRA